MFYFHPKVSFENTAFNSIKRSGKKKACGHETVVIKFTYPFAADQFDPHANCPYVVAVW